VEARGAKPSLAKRKLYPVDPSM